MSLKALHIVFIPAAFFLCATFGAWAWMNFDAIGGGALAIGYVVGSGVALVVLLVYGVYFLRKLRNVSYL